MRNFFEWFQETIRETDHPWLVLGKGPSYSKKAQYDTTGFYTLSLNHVVREAPVTVAHMIDYDVVDACGESLLKNAQVLVMPWVPHVHNDPGPENLAQLAEKNPILQEMSRQGRLLYYNLSTGKRERQGDSPIVRARFFSAEAGLHLLALAGVQTIRSLGIDGGSAYSQAFDDLKDKTLLANGRTTFDQQFGEIPKIILETGVDYAPLDLPSPVRVYVGSTESELLPVKVLEYSIKKHATLTSEVFPLYQAPMALPKPKDAKNHPRTPFSFQRFLIPQWAGYQGRAIYTDSDMQVFQDIRKLWTLPFNGADLLAAREPDSSDRKPQFSVMLLNCDQLRWDVQDIIGKLDSGELTYERLMYDMCMAPKIEADIDPIWNSLERYEEGQTGLIHYTDMPTQPWISVDHPWGHLWFKDLFEALDRGFVTFDFVRQHVERGYLRPSLLYQIEHRQEDCTKIPQRVLNRDKEFIAPYKSIPKHNGTPFKAGRAPAKKTTASPSKKGWLASLKSLLPSL